MTDLTQRLPPELLAKILERVSFPNVLRSKQVNRVFRDVILASPLIQHKIELRAAGLEYNAAAGISLVDSRNALLQYRSNLDSLRPVEKRSFEILQAGKVVHARSGGGAFAIAKDSVQVFTLGSASRGIPHKEWEIPLPVTDLEDFCLYPGDDVIAFVEKRGVDGDLQVKIHLRSLSDGEHHPAALVSTIQHCWRGAETYAISSVLISSSRLVECIAELPGNTMEHLAIWDWKKGQLLFELEEYSRVSVEFINEHRLFFNLDPWGSRAQSLVVVDTEKVMGGAPMRTTFHLSTHLFELEHPILLLEGGVHKPSPADTLAPFYQDPTQRIGALLLSVGVVVFRVGALLELLESHEGSEIGWDEWKDHVVATPQAIEYGMSDVTCTWVS